MVAITARAPAAAPAADRAAARGVAPRPGLVAALLGRYGAFLQRLEDAQRLREMDPRTARDIGAPAGIDACPAGQIVDPRPLWRIGQTPCLAEIPTGRTTAR